MKFDQCQPKCFVFTLIWVTFAASLESVTISTWKENTHFLCFRLDTLRPSSYQEHTQHSSVCHWAAHKRAFWDTMKESYCWGMKKEIQDLPNFYEEKSIPVINYMWLVLEISFGSMTVTVTSTLWNPPDTVPKGSTKCQLLDRTPKLQPMSAAAISHYVINHGPLTG